MYIEIDIERKAVSLPSMGEMPGPFFSVAYSDTGEHTLDSFLRAMSLAELEDAKVYISKNYLNRIDLEELSDALISESKLCVSYVLKTDYHQGPKNCIVKAFIVMEGESASLFNIYMLKEPNRFGKWKIYSIEREETAGVGVKGF